MHRTIAIMALALSAAACSKGGTATATLAGKSGAAVIGNATFTEKDGKVEVALTAKGLPPGKHGVHVHEKGDCSASDASSAGNHFGPGGGIHAAPNDPKGHAGDLGNLEAGADGTGTLTLTTTRLTVAPGERSVVGRAIVIHSEPDDFTTQPSGTAGAGGRIACGVIEKQG
jgi:Cu-Zn family superoxide dismutase